MRSCSTCGTSLEKSSLFCPACGTKVPAESAPTSQHGTVDPLASTAPASQSPARKVLADPKATSEATALSTHDPSGLDPVSPLAGTALAPSPVQGSPPNRSTRGKTAPLAAVPEAQRFLQNAAPPQLAAPPRPQTPLAPGLPARVTPVPPAPPPREPAPPPIAATPLGAPPSPYGPPYAPQPLPGAPFAARASSPPLAPGARVLVQWANGQRYPGTVEQTNGLHCLVRFDAGEHRWVEARYVSPF